MKILTPKGLEELMYHPTLEKAEKFAKKVIGLTPDEANAICNFEKIKIRVVSTDGKKHMVTRDARMDRINVHLENGLITSAHVG